MYLKNPKTNKKIFLDNRYSRYEDRLNEVDKWFLSNDDMIDYCNSNSMIKNKHQINSYYKAQQIMENVATYLLLGQYKKNNILTIYKIRRGYLYELPVTCSISRAQDVMYACNIDEYVSPEIEISLQFSKDKLEKVKKDYYELTLKDIQMQEKKSKSRKASYKKSKSYRMNSLYSTNKIRTYKIKQQFYIDKDGNKKPMKNIIGKPIFDAEYVDIGGNQGIIDDTNMYQSKWCTVDTENRFWYNGDQYEISKKVKQYMVRSDNQCEMTKILVVPRENKLYYFDQNIKKVLDIWIEKVYNTSIESD